LCGGGNDNVKILEVRDGAEDEYFVHYHGWPKRYDEWVPLSRIAQTASKSKSKSKSSSKNPRKSVSPAKVTSPPSSSKKRKTVDEEKETPSSEGNKFEYELPKEVKRLVIHDWEEIVQGKRILSIPRKNEKTISETIGKEYASEVMEDSEARELLQGLVDMFDVV
jgi:mortality factor 4-like protein 1